ncbi:hypothetical protein [Caproiciproducens sp. CPB-2]|uniref:hypothetical protein n=1 Tax=Caproiciproducens sp. CPB-2 TaxID=3030017 RepID=UPI0023DA8D52|nr:hypothetical protein [Caproiciproducens sp. CPB-2]MDF1494431.1 hypothetical protein [Caproiciproducens sp. CPB-2]
MKRIEKIIDHPALPFIASAAGVFAILAPFDWYAFKVAAIAVYFMILSRDSIEKLVLRIAGKSDGETESSFQLICRAFWGVPLILAFLSRRYYFFFAIASFVVLLIPDIIKIVRESKAQNKLMIQKEQVINLLVIAAGIAFLTMLVFFERK